jgi:hypothetical protein
LRGPFPHAAGGGRARVHRDPPPPRLPPSASQQQDPNTEWWRASLAPLGVQAPLFVRQPWTALRRQPGLSCSCHFLLTDHSDLGKSAWCGLLSTWRQHTAADSLLMARPNRQASALPCMRCTGAHSAPCVRVPATGMNRWSQQTLLPDWMSPGS